MALGASLVLTLTENVLFEIALNLSQTLEVSPASYLVAFQLWHTRRCFEPRYSSWCSLNHSSYFENTASMYLFFSFTCTQEVTRIPWVY